MNATEIVKKIMADKGETNASLARKVHCTHSAMFERLKQKNISVDVLVEMLTQLDYQLVIQPATNKVDSSRNEFKVEGSK